MIATTWISEEEVSQLIRKPLPDVHLQSLYQQVLLEYGTEYLVGVCHRWQIKKYFFSRPVLSEQFYAVYKRLDGINYQVMYFPKYMFVPSSEIVVAFFYGLLAKR